ncbi:carbohydrate ABC transporter permease [Paenibacillus aurantiacus]|uniref:Carbohydrate ABC transporter permease n=1 Tax=Paenibacillus aurantiacus TaxID=1936118 RepID=A0ABV5KKQ4_9BACL
MSMRGIQARALEAAPSAKPRAARRTPRGRTVEMWWAYVFVLPAVIVLGVFHLLPAAASLAISFTDWDGLSAIQFAGWDNYAALLADDNFGKAGLHTFLYALAVVPISVLIATLVAVLLNAGLKGQTFYRTVYFIPVVTMSTAVGLIWKWLYNSEYGPINAVLGFLHLPQPSWLSDSRFTLISIMIVGIWAAIGHHMIILLAGLQGIPQSFYEAASIDGAGKLRAFFRITLPLLSPSLFFVVTTSVISSLQLFDLVFVMTGGNPALLSSARSVVFNVYEEGFVLFRMGAASAQAVVLFIIILLLTIVQLKLQKRWVHY